MGILGLFVVSNYAFYVFFKISQMTMICFNKRKKRLFKRRAIQGDLLFIFWDLQKMFKELENWVLPFFSLIRPVNTIKAIIFIFCEYNYPLQIISFDQPGEF